MQALQKVLIVVVACFLLATAYMALVVDRRQNAIQKVGRYNISWSAGQAVNEFLRLRDQIAAVAIPGTGVTREDVALRLDILASRVDTLRSGEFLHFIERFPRLGETLERLSVAIGAVERGFSVTAMPQAAIDALAVLAPLDAKMTTLAVEANQFSVDQAETDQKELNRLHWIFSGLASGLILCGVLLIGLLLLQNRVLVQVQARLRDLAAHLERMAHRDALTGLANRTLFQSELDRQLSSARQGSGGVSIFLLDLDRFKDVNDTLGHVTGDKLLARVADRLLQSVGPGDVVARLGGDEFAVLCASEDEGAAVALGERLMTRLNEPYVVDGQELVTGMSLGLAHGASGIRGPDQLLKQADIALYEAKAEGRGRFRVFEPAMEAQLHDRIVLAGDLRNALRRNEMAVFYQPIVGTEDRSVRAYEALLRWNHPTRGSVPPSVFIPIAEDTGFIAVLGGWVLRQACIEASTWPPDVKVAVNLSPVQFRSCELVRTVGDALAASGVNASRLELEITETVLLDPDERTLSILRELHQIGVRIALDDFGTGYSSLSYLQRFPFDKLKIDQSFVRDIGIRPDAMSIVKLIIEIGGTLHMAVTAEGVETEEQLACLRAAGCAEAQGYLFDTAKPASELTHSRWPLGVRASVAR